MNAPATEQVLLAGVLLMSVSSAGDCTGER